MKDFDFEPETSTGTLVGAAILPRELADLSIWKKTPFDPAHALCDLFMVANTEAGEHRLGGGMVVAFAAGECLWSNKALAERWGWKRETVEKFMVELERAEIITRRDIGQSRKVLKLCDFVQVFGQRSGHQTGHQNGQQFGQQKDTDRDRDRVSEPEEAPRVVTLEQAISWCRANGVDYSDDQIREQFFYYDAARRLEDGMWMRSTPTGAQFPISDWRSELCRALAKFAVGQNGSENRKKGGEVSASVQAIQNGAARRSLQTRLREVTEEIESLHQAGAPISNDLQAEERDLQKALAQLTEVGV